MCCSPCGGTDSRPPVLRSVRPVDEGLSDWPQRATGRRRGGRRLRIHERPAAAHDQRLARPSGGGRRHVPSMSDFLPSEARLAQHAHTACSASLVLLRFQGGEVVSTFFTVAPPVRCALVPCLRSCSLPIPMLSRCLRSVMSPLRSSLFSVAPSVRPVAMMLLLMVHRSWHHCAIPLTPSPACLWQRAAGHQRQRRLRRW